MLITGGLSTIRELFLVFAFMKVTTLWIDTALFNALGFTGDLFSYSESLASL